MNATYLTERIPRSEAMRRALTDTLHLEGLALHPDDRAVLEAWARHEFELPQAIERLHTLLDEAASTLTPEERQTRALAAFPTLRLAELQCYGLDQLSPPATPAPLGRDLLQAEILMTHPTESSSDPEFPMESEPVAPSSTLTLEQQLADIGAQLLASAQRLATDEKHRLEIQKLLF